MGRELEAGFVYTWMGRDVFVLTVHGLYAPEVGRSDFRGGLR